MADINFEGTNLLGAPFKPYVDQQINQRQTRLGKIQKDNQEIVWQNAKSAYVALASSVDIENTIFITTTPAEIVDTSFMDEIKGISSKPQKASFADKALGTPTKTVTTTTTEIIEDGTKRIQQLNLPGTPDTYFGNYLANNLVLFGGTAYYEVDSSGSYSNPYYRSGLSTSNSLLNNSAYGFGGTSFGLSAMPGLTSFNIKSRNMGSLREASVTIRANNEEQFKLIDSLYCRIGYSMFIEWGNSIYFDNNGKYVSNPNSEGVTSLIPIFLSGKNGDKAISDNPNQLLQLIEKRREKSNGNYDAFFGKVKNFSWEFNKNGYYEINLSLISQGDIIESLNIDGQYGTTSTLGNAEGQLQPQANETSALTSFLATAASPSKTTSTIIIPASFGPDGSTPEQTITREEFKNFKTTLVPDITTSKVTAGGTTGFSLNPTVTNTTSSLSSDTVPSLNYTRLESSVGKIVSATATFSQEKPYFYVRLGDILDFIKDRLLVYNSKGNNEPILDIDTDTDKNIMYNPGINVSSDPSKVMVRCDLPFLKGELEILSKNKVEKTSTGNAKIDWPYPVRTNGVFSYKDAKLEYWESKRDPNNKTNRNFPLHGKIMNIYFEYQYLLDTIQNLRNEVTGTISLYDFVEQLCQTANSCLGGVNNLTVRLEDDKVMRIYDQNPIYGTQNVKNSIINLFGVKPQSGSLNQGSFVTDFNIKTELTNDFATQVTIGAQAQSNNVGSDSTGLSSWNSGLKDRFFPQKIDSLRKNGNVEQPTTLERIEKLTEQLKYLWLGYSEANITNVDTGNVLDISISTKILYFKNFQTKRYSEFVKLQKDWLQEIIKLENEIFNKKKVQKSEQTLGTNQIGMLPINISVTLEGISGIRIYDKLEVDTRFLPSYYPQTLIWIIKGVSHEIQNNKWYTKLETIAVPKLPPTQDFDEALGRDKKDDNKEDEKEVTTPPRPTNGLIDVTWNYENPIRRKIIDSYGWPIEVQEINGRYYAEAYSQDTAKRNLYRRSQEYLNNTTTTFEYKLTTFKTIKIKNINKDLVAPLTTVLDSIKAKNLSIGVVSIDAVIYPRDTTGKSNIGKLSGHSFGVALDVNAANFPYGNAGYETYLKRLENGDLRAKVIKEFVDSGLFEWGGDYKNTKDAHHFSLKSIGNI